MKLFGNINFFEIMEILILVATIIFTFVSFFPYDIKEGFVVYLFAVLIPLLMVYGFLSKDSLKQTD